MVFSGGLLRVLAATTTFSSAFLLFAVQPMIAKLILPWFGGSAAVWSTALVFFQVMLLLGYAYAHALTRWLSPVWQFFVHGAVLIMSVAMLPVMPDPAWRPTGHENPAAWILGLLTVTVGLPYFALAATSPLTQAWLSRDGRIPASAIYRYYALSNGASLVALIAYPLVVERALPGPAQSYLWSAAFGLFALCCGWLGWRTMTAARPAGALANVAEEPGLARQMQWLVLAFVASALSLSVTNHLCMNVAAIPFLWVLPLAVYLSTLILCFDSDRWYRRAVALPIHGLALAGAAWVLLHETPEWSVRVLAPVFALTLFTGCFYLHGELAARRPATGQLTRFYLIMSLGGALGALTVALGAPVWLRANHELAIALSAVALTTLFLEYRRHLALDLAWAAVAVFVIVHTGGAAVAREAAARVSVRNFHGALRIVDQPERVTMVHGVVSHGTQLRDRPSLATAYYGPGSGIEFALRERRQAMHGRPLRVGVIGLGAGTLAAYGKPGDVFRFYELNAEVDRLARREFTYLRDSAAHCETVVGDGRLSLEREAPQRYDILAVDAFSGDSVPVHLLSREALAVYRRHLAPGGWIALHVSNSVLDLVPVARALDPEHAAHLHVDEDRAIGRSESDWVVLGVLTPAIQRSSRATARRAKVWTDDHHDLFSVLK